MKTFEEINALKGEEISLVTGGDGGAIYGKDLKPDPERQTVEVTFMTPAPGSNGGAIYTGDPEPQQYIGGIVFVGNTPGQSGGAIING